MKSNLAMVLIVLLASSVGAETLTVYPDGTITSTSFLTEVGKIYTIQVEGTFKYGDLDFAQADAEWLLTNPQPTVWTEHHNNNVLPEDQIDLTINEQFIDWLDYETVRTCYSD